MNRLNTIKYTSLIIIVLLLLIWWVYLLYNYNYFETFRIKRRRISTPKPKVHKPKVHKPKVPKSINKVVKNTEQVATTSVKAVEKLIPVVDLTALVDSASRFVKSITNISNAF